VGDTLQPIIWLPGLFARLADSGRSTLQDLPGSATRGDVHACNPPGRQSCIHIHSAKLQ
jgi:hypothetical protein